MSRDFDRVDAALAASAAGRVVIFVQEAVASAWRRSSTGRVARSIRRELGSAPAPTAIRTIAIATGIAAAAQPLLTRAMPATVAPAMPWPAFALVALFAGVAAWQADALAKAWPGSRLARVLGR